MRFVTIRTVPEAFCLCMCGQWWYIESLLMRYLINCLWEFHQIYNFGVVGHKDELFNLKFKETARHKTVCGEIDTLGGSSSPIFGMHW